jgi:hypothetical protein
MGILANDTITPQYLTNRWINGVLAIVDAMFDY